jgi:hypothetical protein
MNVAQVRHIQLVNSVRKGVRSLNPDNHTVEVECTIRKHGRIDYTAFIWDGRSCVGHTMLWGNSKPVTAKQLIQEFRKNLQRDLANKEAQRLDVEQTED